MENEELFKNYIVQYTDKSVLDKIKDIAEITYECSLSPTIFINTTDVYAKEIKAWDEIFSIELDDNKGSVFL